MKTTGRGRPLTSLKGFIDRVQRLEQVPGCQYFYRGHARKGKYVITPSVFRTEKGQEHEDRLFRELISTNPSEFRDDTSALERLARMQHHSCPTRLLDITTNPLVALYFACNEHGGEHAEVIAFRVDREIVKFFDSDTVSCIANMARMSLDDKKALLSSSVDVNNTTAGRRLLHFVKEEKPYFEPKILREDLSRVVVVRPTLNSRRILAQSGAFLLFGRLEPMDQSDVDGIVLERISVDAASKSKIVSSLDAVGLNEGSMYLDIDSYARHIKRSYGIV